jgi:hemoglobin
MPSIYEHLGPHLIAAAVDGFYARVLGDRDLVPFFVHMDVSQQKKRMTMFLYMVTGGPGEYRGADMRRAHDRPVSQGMSDIHFDRVVDHLVAELRELTVPEHLIAQLGTMVESLRNEVLHR